MKDMSMTYQVFYKNSVRRGGTVGPHIILTKLTKPVRALPTLLSKTDLAASSGRQPPDSRGAKSAHEHGQGAELGPPYSKGVLIQGLDTATALI
ncbi:hypothetical protein J6590_089101 [Homalodisca vitripennis]|nr:hypothetical protein J6590_089101 [Homalodisca vitripennis]